MWPRNTKKKEEDILDKKFKQWHVNELLKHSPKG